MLTLFLCLHLCLSVQGWTSLTANFSKVNSGEKIWKYFDTFLCFIIYFLPFFIYKPWPLYWFILIYAYLCISYLYWRIEKSHFLRYIIFGFQSVKINSHQHHSQTFFYIYFWSYLNASISNLNENDLC